MKSLPLAALLFLTPHLHAQQSADVEPGHSEHGRAFDQGPRQRPWKMQGIGQVHFPITSSVPEVQEWFDQGIALLHSFWYYEAERAFRWCVKLDPECALAYWGMALAAEPGSERFEPLLAEAQRRKDKVSERERLYIEAWVGARAPRLEGRFEAASVAGDELRTDVLREQENVLLERLEKIIVRYPDDIEAKAFYALEGLHVSGRVANEALLQQILAVAPDHPGAHHYRIHNWDGSQECGAALESCRRYGKIAWEAGHANHMPGHVYSGLGMWREAAIWMESATRIELRQMQERGLFPYDYWNFAHNRNYLAYIQEQNGLVEEALLGARTLLGAPTNPERGARAGEDYVQLEGQTALVRALLKFERWDEILKKGAIPWKETDRHKAWRAYAEALAHLGQGDLPAAIASATELEKVVHETKDEGEKKAVQRWFREVDALVRLQTERELEGLSELEELAREQARDFDDDPPDDREPLYDILGELYLGRGSPQLAADCFGKGLELVRNDAFALSGLARAEVALGHTVEATRAWGRLRDVWAHADPGLRWLESARALGLDSEPIDESPEKQRDYDPESLAELGPIAWEPFPAPELAAVAADGKRVGLEELRGKNVLLVFYLGGGCVHCVEELASLAKRAVDFARLDTILLAVSADAPADLKKPEPLANLDLRLLSDSDHASARRFHAWDDFEEIPLHATILIDRAGRERWARVGGDPFRDVDFLLAELGRWGKEPGPGPVAGEAASPKGSF